MNSVPKKAGSLVSINFVFWWMALLYVVGLHWLYLGAVEGVASDRRLSIFFFGCLSALLVIVPVILLDSWLTERRRSWLSFSWSLMLALLAGALYADLCLFNVMAIHLGTALRLLLGNSVDHFFVTLDATGVRLQAVRDSLLVFLVFAALVIVLRFVIYRFPNLFFKVPKRILLGSGCLTFTAVLGIEYCFPQTNRHLKLWEEVHRVMPLTFRTTVPVGTEVHTGNLIPLVCTSNNSMEQMNPSGAGSTPDIFIFILESVRADFVNLENTPALAALKGECLSVPDAFANANATQVSWFSLLTARNPLYFSAFRKATNCWGTGPLAHLRNAGYFIHAFAATHLNYYNIDQLVFGEKLHLTQSITDCRRNEIGSLPRGERDREIIKKFIQEANRGNGGRVFLVFLESTHHDYYWAKDFSPPFHPFCETWDYTDFRPNPDKLIQIKNRYRNSLYFTDGLIGAALSELRSAGLYENSIIFLTGDHGEEFAEHGKMVHASELCREQTRVPFLFKPPSNTPMKSRVTNFAASHLDFFPTVFDILQIKPDPGWDGESLFSKSTALLIAADDNGFRDPHRFTVTVEDKKFWFSYRSDSTLTMLEKSVILTRITDKHDAPLPPGLTETELIAQYFEPIANRLFLR